MRNAERESERLTTDYRLRTVNDLRVAFRQSLKAPGLTVMAVLAFATRLHAGEPKIGFWDTPRHGANFFNHVELKERFVAARQVGIEFVRLAPNKWLNGRPEARRGDFLLGRPERFSGLDTNDVALLRRPRPRPRGEPQGCPDDAQPAG